ncbi:efflux RND transporter periplasmic adaptor subunit [Aliidiomarina minuta]|uniref:Efflux RND transporter periplasmic adaptor subunit n=1 Tax=Aliidiomarina minuta TaxID=880057 RepID=A0A432W7U0_9GAMM|nr:efflux RND transporter periplasmic adaptor subunit [Aliidiomarina minuta]RUO26071.1 efflux RND transporter periplasmic adaptor subunit [Aliidiomarina minuta]
MASKKRIFLPVIILVLALVIAFVLASSRTPPQRGGPERLPVLVEYQEVEIKDQAFRVPAQGSVKPKYDTDLVAEVSGQVVYVADKFVAGGFFEAGDVMLRIDPSDYETARQEAQANVAQAEAQVAEERALSQVAETEWRSIQEGDIEIPALGLREPQLASAMANLQSAEARLAQSERNLQRTNIRAPFSGVLQQKQANLGQYVGTGSVVGRLYGTDVAEVRLPLTDLDLALLDIPTGLRADEAGPAVTLSSQISGRQQLWQASVVRTEGVLDATSQVTYAVAEVQDPYNRQGPSHEIPLAFGRFVEAQIEGITLADMVELPRYAVHSGGFVWIISGDEERILERREVEVQRRDRHTVFIRAGLEAGEKVLLTQLDNPLPGQRVRLPGDEVEPAEESMDDDSVQPDTQNGGDD